MVKTNVAMMGIALPWGTPLACAVEGTGRPVPSHPKGKEWSGNADEATGFGIFEQASG